MHHKKRKTYVKRLAVEREHSGRENALSTIKDRTGVIESRFAVDYEHVLKDAPVDGRGNIGRDGNIVVIHIDVGELGDLEEVCVNLDSLAGGTGLGPFDELCQAKAGHGGGCGGGGGGCGGVFFFFFFFFLKKKEKKNERG